MYHSPSRDSGMLQIEPITALCTVPAINGVEKKLYAFRAFNAGSELDMLHAVQALTEPILSPIPIPPSASSLVDTMNRTSLPVLMPWLLGGRPLGERYERDCFVDRQKRWSDRSQLRSEERKQKSRVRSTKTQKQLKEEADDLKEEQAIDGYVTALRHSLSRSQRKFVRDTQQSIVRQFGLNSDQQRVLERCVSWIDDPRPNAPSMHGEHSDGRDQTTDDSEDESSEKHDQKTGASNLQASSAIGSDYEPSPITLVHGTFGSGKSHLLVVIILFWCRVLDVLDPTCNIKILVAAQTNVAVDGILVGLKAKGFDKFARVGSLPAIAKPVLMHVMHTSRGSQDDGNRFAQVLIIMRADPLL